MMDYNMDWEYRKMVEKQYIQIHINKLQENVLFGDLLHVLTS